MDSLEPYLTSVKVIPSAVFSDTLGSVIYSAKSGSDAILVFDLKEKNLLGIVSPSYCLFKHRYPPDTRLSHCMIVPPKIKISDTFYDVALHMLSLGVYTLPVFDKKDNIIGVISGRGVLKAISENSEILRLLSRVITPAKPLISTMHASVGEVYSKLRKEKSSRVIIVNKSGAIEGILTRRDLQNAFVAPSTGIRRGSNPSKGIKGIGFNEEEITRFDFPVAEFYNPRVVTVQYKAQLKQVLKEMLEKMVNSVVIVNKNNKPMGILSTRLILLELVKNRPKSRLSIEVSDRHQLLTVLEKKSVSAILERFANKLHKRRAVKNVEFFVEASKNLKGKVNSYETSVFFHFSDGQKVGSKVVDRKLMSGVKDVIRKIEKQLYN